MHRKFSNSFLIQCSIYWRSWSTKHAYDINLVTGVQTPSLSLSQLDLHRFFSRHIEHSVKRHKTPRYTTQKSLTVSPTISPLRASKTDLSRLLLGVYKMAMIWYLFWWKSRSRKSDPITFSPGVTGPASQFKYSLEVSFIMFFILAKITMLCFAFKITRRNSRRMGFRLRADLWLSRVFLCTFWSLWLICVSRSSNCLIRARKGFYQHLYVRSSSPCQRHQGQGRSTMTTP